MKRTPVRFTAECGYVPCAEDKCTHIAFSIEGSGMSLTRYVIATVAFEIGARLLMFGAVILAIVSLPIWAPFVAFGAAKDWLRSMRDEWERENKQDRDAVEGGK